MQGIYLITNNINGHRYVGQSNDIERRWTEHRNAQHIRKGRTVLNKAFRKYGIKNFTFSIIELVMSRKDLNEREMYWIAFLHPEYNMTLGGDGTKGLNVSEETRKKLSKAGKCQWENLSKNEKEYIAIYQLIGPRKGHTVFEETKEKLRKANLGKKQSVTTIRKRAKKLSTIMKGNANGNKEVIVVVIDDLDIKIYKSIKEAAVAIKGEYTQMIRRLKINGVYKRKYALFYSSVETIGDECNRVGVILSHAEVRGILQKDEEIAHSAEMENLRVSDKGVVQLALRSGQFKRLNVTDVRDGEFGGIDLLSGDVKLNFVEDRENKPVIGYVAYFQLANGFEKALYWTKAQCEAHGKRYSQTYASHTDYVRKSSKWTTDFDAMAKKTVLKQLLTKYAPMSVEMQMGVQADQAVIRVDDEGNESLDYVDNGNNHSDFSQVAEDAVAVEVSGEQTTQDNGSGAA